MCSTGVDKFAKLPNFQREAQHITWKTSLLTYTLGSSSGKANKMFKGKIQECILTHKWNFFLKNELKLHAVFSSFSKNKMSSHSYTTERKNGWIQEGLV